MSLKNIKDGWLNYIRTLVNKRSLDPKFKDEIDKRAQVCGDCPELMIRNFSSTLLKGKCRRCGCSYPALIFAPRKRCPIGKWGRYEP